MEIHLTSTTKIVQFEIDGKIVPARIWEGHTENGILCHAYITRIACAEDEDQTEFSSQLQSHDAPSPAIEAISMRMVL